MKRRRNDFSFNLPDQLQEGNSSNRFSIMERRLTGSKGGGISLEYETRDS